MPESGMSGVSPFSLSLSLDCLHKLILALRAYSCLKEKYSLTQFHLFNLGQSKSVESIDSLIICPPFFLPEFLNLP